MSATTNWPPKSPHAALLSSPSGRRKFLQSERETPISPIRRSAITPHFVEDADEDEETLQLQLAAIEAKLKLKKLQQNKARSQVTATRPQIQDAQIEVPVSPKKQSIPPYSQRSPGRILLGIDKGMTSADISLKRARTVHGSPGKLQDGSNSRLSTFGSTRSRDARETKTFSERMAEARDTDRSSENKRNSRVRGAVKLDDKELERYRLAAENSRQQPISPRRPRAFSRDEVLQTTQPLKKSRTLPDLRQAAETAQADPTLFEPFSDLNLSSRILPDSFLKRTLPSEAFTCMRIPDLLKQVTSPAYELPDSVIDLALFGIIASKSSPMDHKQEKNSKVDNDWEKKWDDGSQNQRKFMVLTITDLKWTLDLYLFGTAVPRYHRLTPGTVVCILNPSVMPPKKGREDTGVFSLTLHSSDDTVLEIGSSRDLGFCSSIKKDGKPCGSWVNSSKTDICEFHLNLQVAKTQSGRMGVNAGMNGLSFGGAGEVSRNKYNIHNPGSRKREQGEGQHRGLLPRNGGPRYDRSTSSQFYIASSTAGNRGSGTPIYRPERSTAHMLDQDDDDPFIAEGQLSRDKEGRMRRRLENQAKERDIAEKLITMGSGGAGGDYLRHRFEKKEITSESGSQRSALVNRSAVWSSGSRDGTKKRTAESVRLSPVKKTRFLTDKGIKIAGRESLGPNMKRDDDDGLDIV